jgi:quinoprotein glucose dehydrogenase
MGHLFILNRETGEPLFPVEERPVPQNWEVPGNTSPPTQPFPVKPAPLHPATVLDADDAWGLHVLGPRARAASRSRRCATKASSPRLRCRARLFYPSDMGGNNWGTPAIDPGRGAAHPEHAVHALPMLQLIPRDQCEAAGKESLVTRRSSKPRTACASNRCCHRSVCRASHRRGAR